MKPLQYTYSGNLSLQDLLGENILYRDLNPVSEHYPSFQMLRRKLGIQQAFPPRKNSPQYVEIILEYLRLSQPEPFDQLLFFGDTPGYDGALIRNLSKINDLRVFGFIGKEALSEAPALADHTPIFLSNRWNLIPAFLGLIQKKGFHRDRPTAVIFDMDKTLIGARGRNDAVIDEARMEGVKKLIQKTLQEEWDKAHFFLIYNTFNQARYHFLTEDNQDYLAFVCLMILANVWRFEELLDFFIQKKITTFQAFLDQTAARLQTHMSPAVQDYFEEVFPAVSRGDPTPFVSFRRMEYLATIERIDSGLNRDPEEILRSEITLTQELVDLITFLKDKNFGPIWCISDKPPQSTFPTESLEKQGYIALHKKPMKVVGLSLKNL
ncbi:hypothetical protein BMS3Abin05_01736 [bacterium BMS3Abin05]|nr:hypothetical protein BMS3Abin05_01736 [bacterium BMS3Abin05]GBE28451.1 hypothetical protein BMS3Bbin03_02390 [bacterium BMS3Bbin03]HDL78430.1 hypothetical protein [Bacteroidota bacterium]HDZ12154.1 hypothetical protein [Bacteroidota bacterium]